MTGWTKLFNSIVTSSIWEEDNDTRIVWITMLAMADKDGQVIAALPRFAKLANVDVNKCQQAITKLSNPDPDSRTPDNDGRRIKKIQGGWLILNHWIYREKGRALDRREYLRQKKREERARKRAAAGKTEDVNNCQHSQPIADTDTDTDTDKPPISPKGDKGKDSPVSGRQKITPEIQQVFDTWNQHAGKSVNKPNGRGTTDRIAWKAHKKLGKEKVAAIRQALKDYSVDEIVGAIDNFAAVLLGREYFWSYPWTLDQFLTRGRERHKGAERQWWQFLPDNFDAERYRRHGAESEVVFEDPSVEEAEEIARRLDRQAEARRAAI